MHQTYIIIPVYNEVKVLKKVLAHPALQQFNLVIVDDCSTDNPDYKMLQINGHILRHSVNLGQGATLQTGMAYAQKQGAKYIVHFDADGQHDANEINSLLEPLLDGSADVVLGSRFIDNELLQPGSMPAHRLFMLRCARLVQFIFTGIRLSDSQNGFRAFSASAYALIKIRHNRMAHAIEIIQIISKHKLRVIEKPVKILYTSYSLQKGQKNLNGFGIVAALSIERFLEMKEILTLLTGIFVLSSVLLYFYRFEFLLIVSSVTSVFLVTFYIFRKLRRRSICRTEGIRQNAILNVTICQNI